MPTVKTAISIDRKLYKKVQAMAVKYRLSKSKIFSQAVEYVVHKDEGIDLINKINMSLDSVSLSEASHLVTMSKKKYTRNVVEKW